MERCTWWRLWAGFFHSRSYGRNSEQGNCISQAPVARTRSHTQIEREKASRDWPPRSLGVELMVWYRGNTCAVPTLSPALRRAGDSVHRPASQQPASGQQAVGQSIRRWSARFLGLWPATLHSENMGVYSSLRHGMEASEYE